MMRELLREFGSSLPSEEGGKAGLLSFLKAAFLRRYTTTRAIPPKMKRPAPMPMPTRAPVVRVDDEAPGSVSVMSTGVPVISTLERLKGEPEMPRSVPPGGFWWQPAWRVVRTDERAC